MKDIKIEYVYKDCLIPKTFVNFRLNNKLYNGYFLIDLGSDISIIFDKYRLNSKDINSEVLSIGDIECKQNTNFQVLKPNETELFDSFTGILGLSFLSKNNLKIDFKLMKLSFDINIPNNRIQLPSYFIDNYLILVIKIAHNKFNFLYDTGSSLDLIFFENRIGDLGLNNEDSKVELGEGLVSSNYEIVHFNKHLKCSIEKIELNTKLKVMKENSMSNQTPKNINGIIGNKIFTNKQIIIDYSDQKFYTI